jgi:hypothetical protein
MFSGKSKNPAFRGPGRPLGMGLAPLPGTH